MIGFKKKSRQIVSSALAVGLTLGTMAFNGIEVKAATNFNYGDAFQKALMFYEFQLLLLYLKKILIVLIKFLKIKTFMIISNKIIKKDCVI